MSEMSEKAAGLVKKLEAIARSLAEVGQTVADLFDEDVRAEVRPCSETCPGWADFESAEHGLQIQRCDECRRYATDEDAWVAARPYLELARALAVRKAPTDLDAYDDAAKMLRSLSIYFRPTSPKTTRISEELIRLATLFNPAK